MPRPSSDKSDRLKRAAMTLFHERGYASVSLRDVAASADVPAGAVFYHFPTKAALGAAVADARTASVVAMLDAMTREEGSPAGRLARLADGLASVAPLTAEHGC